LNNTEKKLLENNVDSSVNSDSKESIKTKSKLDWDAVDEHCPHCGGISKPARGINRQNMKRLFSLKMNFNDIMTILLVAMLLLSVYRYMNDTAECRTFLNSGSQKIWNDMVDSGISIDSLLASSKAKTQLNPLLLSEGLKTNFTDNLTEGT